MRIFKSSLALLSFLIVTAAAWATNGQSLQMQAGNPSGATADSNNHTHYLLQRAQYALDYNDTLGQPNWVSWDLTAGDHGTVDRSDFTPDPNLPVTFYAVTTGDYNGVGNINFNRGHMCPSADRNDTSANNIPAFYMTNIVPQSADNNQGPWEKFEEACRDLTSGGRELLIVSGASQYLGSKIPSGKAFIPGFTWKIVVVIEPGAGTAASRATTATRVIAIKMPNVNGTIRSDPWENYKTTVAQIEADTGFTFFGGLDPTVAAALRAAPVDGGTAAAAPTITTAPAPQAGPVGSTATFSVVANANGNPPLTYQWRKDGDNLAGETNSTLSLTNLQASSVGNYDVIVFNTVGSTTSSTAALVVTGLPPSITTPPASQTILAGNTATFSVAVSGSPTLSYQWKKGTTNLTNGGKVSGATAPVLTLTNVQAGEADTYSVVVTNSVSSATSTAATLTVTPSAPFIVNQPTGAVIAPAGTATFSVTAGGTEPLAYQWFKGSTAIDSIGNASAATATLTLTNVQSGDAAAYHVVVSNSVSPAATSNDATLTVSANVNAKSYAGGTYTQNFDTLPSTGTTTLTGTAPFYLSGSGVNSSALTGWAIASTAGTPTLIANGGTTTNGATYSFGIAGTNAVTDRALGTIASGSVIPRFGLVLVNNTGQTITQFTVSFAGEYWRNGGNASLATQTLPFAYSVGAADINVSTGFTNVPALAFTSPTPSGSSGAAVDGNATGNRQVLTSTISSISWTPGQTLVLRWDDTNDTGNDHGLAIDDFSFTTPVAAAPTVPSVALTTPANNATGVAVSAPITVKFDQAVNVSGTWFAINSTNSGPVTATVTTSDFITFTFTPSVNFAFGDTVTVNLFAAQITEKASGTLHPASNTTFSFATQTATPPDIATQPTPQSVGAGATATFTVSATGTAPLAYQWRKGGNPITGNTSANTATLVISNVQASDMANYDVVVTNAFPPAATSNAVALTVTPAAPTITTQPISKTVNSGATVTFTVAASGTSPFTYTWRKQGTPLTNGAVVSGATTATLTLTNVAAVDAGSYDVLVGNGVGSPTASSVASLTINTAPAGQISYAGGAYTQNFDTLPATGTFTLTGTGPLRLDDAAGVNATGMTGWTMAKNTGSGSAVLFRVDAGSSNSGSVYSYGTGTATDRSLGSLGSGTIASHFGVTLVNTSGQTITQFTLAYTGEEWRHGGAATANKLTFAYGLGATDLITGTFTPATSLDFTGLLTTNTTSALDGNANGNRAAISASVTGISWAPGQTLVLRWTDVDDSGSDDGLAIDDLTFSTTATVKTPATVALSNTSQGYDGTAKSVTVTTSPANLATAVTYDGSSTVPSLPGNYAVVATITQAGYSGSASGTLSISKNSVAITFSNLSATYDGTPKSVTVTTQPAFPVTVPYSGSATPPTDAGTYLVAATVNSPTTTGNGSAEFTIAKATQSITFGALPGSIAVGSPFTLSATASSGLPVTLSVVSGNATVAGNSVTLVDSSSVTLRATQVGNNNYNAATADITVSASTSKQSQTIAFAALSDQVSSAGPISLSATASSGLPVSFSLVSGPATLSGSTLTLTGAAGTVTVRAAQAGNGTFNAAPNVDRSFAVSTAAVAPRITTQPGSQVALVGGSASFSVVATGTPAPTYQWRKDGANIPNATGAGYSISAAALTDAAGYDVVVTNSAGSVTSSLARLTVNAVATAPVITRQPGSVTLLIGRAAAFSVVAAGAPAPAYQWTKSGSNIPGATGSTYSIASVAAGDAGTYAVVVTNSAGSVTSSTAVLGIIRRSFAGAYFGSLGNGGSFALYIKDDNTGIFLGFLPGSSQAFVSRGVTVDDNGNFSFTVTVIGANPASDDNSGGSLRAFAKLDADFVFAGTISATGSLSTSSSSSLPLSATKSPDSGATAATAGFYQASAAGSSAQTLAIVSPAGQAFVVTQNGTTADGGSGTVDATGKLAVTTARGSVSGNVSADTSITATVTSGGSSTTFAGYADTSAALAQQRIVNLSTRTTAGIGDQVAIVGFVITGLESKPVLIRGVGPTLRGLGVATALAAPRLELRSNSGALLLSNTGWTTAGNTAEIANAATRSGAFPLIAASADSAILTTLAPGAYTAVLSAADAKPGVGLVEVYDLSGGSTAQKLANLSTRAAIGTGEATLISGVVVGGTAPKRVLIRAAGPALAQFGVTGALARPALTLFNAGGTTIAQNTGWSTSADATAIVDGAASVGAFAFAAGSADSALIVNLSPGAYTAQVTGVSGATGITLFEVYELP